MTKKQILKQIATYLDCFDEEDMTTAERQIAELLIQNEVAYWKKMIDHSRHVERKEFQVKNMLPPNPPKRTVYLPSNWLDLD